ncbi:hypothetical protein [Novosphingobium sp. M1R2S20]|uniref:Uncharacterized protein n=1 Tax=Novosphingobium rhizovicinum TaxID=3228928 RepID=A0ABV3RCV5_9SPHN
MTTIPIPSGPSNKEIIDLAYLALGVSDAMFGRTDDEYASAMTILRAMMGEYPFDQLGFDTYDDNVTERSGIDARWKTAVAYSLAERLSSTTVQKAMPSASMKTKADSYSRLCAFVNVAPTMRYADGTAGGSGRRGYRTYITDAS